MTTKTADSKGRVALGKDFANSPVIVERISPTEVRVVKARVIPEDEAWLWDNEKALAGVKRGLEQAKNREFAESAPDLDCDELLAGELDSQSAAGEPAASGPSNPSLSFAPAPVQEGRQGL